MASALFDPKSQDLDEDFWEDLLTLIETGKVIPVAGAGIVTIGPDDQPFYPWLSRRLAEKLGIPATALPPIPDLSTVSTAHLLNQGNGNAIYTRIARIIRDEPMEPGTALRSLASVSAFNLFLTTTFDPLLRTALDQMRHGGAERTTVLSFSPEGELRDLPARRRDLGGTTLYHLLGRVSSSPDYVVWEEDLVEFLVGLNRHMQVLERLGRDLKDHGLLILGLSFSDWLVRLFLRVSKQERLSAIRVHGAYLAEQPGELTPQSLVMFFGAVSRDIHLVRHDPIQFCNELARRWQERHPSSSPSPLAVPQKVNLDEVNGAIFISYAREDEAAVAVLVRGLEAAGCDVWYDRQRLEAGQNWHNGLEDAVKRRCSLFLSVVSRTTESTRESYYHLERNWAAQRAERISHDEEFFLPVVIDESDLELQREPRVFRHIQATRLPGGQVTEEFQKRVLYLQKRAIGRPDSER